MVSWISRKKKEGIFSIVYFVQREFTVKLVITITIFMINKGYNLYLNVLNMEGVLSYYIISFPIKGPV